MHIVVKTKIFLYQSVAVPSNNQNFTLNLTLKFFWSVKFKGNSSLGFLQEAPLVV